MTLVSQTLISIGGLLLAAHVVAAQEDSGCPQGAGPVPIDDPTAQQVALLLGSKWYNPSDHPACDSLPAKAFLNSVNVTQACVDPPYTAESVSADASQTFFVSFDGTVPCSESGKEKLLEENPDIPFTLQFEAEATYPSLGNGDGVLRGELVGPPTKPENWSITAPIRDLGECSGGTSKGVLDDPEATKIAQGAAAAYYEPAEHATCGSQPQDAFLNSIKILNVCTAADGNRTVIFEATMPCTDAGKKELLAEKPYAFTFQFEAKGNKDGETKYSSIIGGDGKLVPPFTCPDDDCSFSTSRSPMAPSAENPSSSVGTGDTTVFFIVVCILISL